MQKDKGTVPKANYKFLSVAPDLSCAQEKHFVFSTLFPTPLPRHHHPTPHLQTGAALCYIIS